MLTTKRILLITQALMSLLFLQVTTAQTIEVSDVSIGSGLEKQDGLKRQIISFVSDNLKQYALLIGTPENHNSVLIYAHGFHPQPAKNGFNSAGENDRPGDYYREIIESYAKAGFNVLVPDYRGHNISEGLEQITSESSRNGSIASIKKYSRDLVAAYQAYCQLFGKQNVAISSHSMGGAVTVLALDRMAPNIKAVSLWSPMAMEPPSKKYKAGFMIHHGARDTSTPVKNSTSFIKYLDEDNYHFYTYQTADHLLTKSDLQTALARDIKYFNMHLSRLQK